MCLNAIAKRFFYCSWGMFFFFESAISHPTLIWPLENGKVTWLSQNHRNGKEKEDVSVCVLLFRRFVRFDHVQIGWKLLAVLLLCGKKVLYVSTLRVFAWALKHCHNLQACKNYQACSRTDTLFPHLERALISVIFQVRDIPLFPVV